MRTKSDTAGQFSTVSLDSVREYWNARPCNVRHSTQELGTREYFDEVEARRYFVEPHIPRFAQFEDWAGKRVLEVGCGIGTDTIAFARAGANVTAVDLSEESLALARKRAEVYGLADRIEFYCADAEHLADVVPAAAYDLIYSFGVIHHTPDPKNAIAQLRENFTKDDTVLKVMVYNRRSWKVLWILLTEGRGRFWQLDKWIARNSEAQTGCPVTYTYTRSTVQQLLSGFDVKECDVDFIFPYRISDYVKHRYVKNWYFRVLPPAAFRLLERRFGWNLLVTAVPTPPARTASHTS